MELYFKIKLISDYLIPLIIFGTIIIITFIKITIEEFRWRRIERFFESNGYTRELLRTASVGTNHFYGWRREADRRVVWDKDLKGMTIRQIKQKYK